MYQVNELLIWIRFSFYIKKFGIFLNKKPPAFSKLAVSDLCPDVSRRRFLILIFPQKFIDKVLLSLTSHLSGPINPNRTVWIVDRAFFYLKQIHFHTALRWHIPVATTALDQVSIVT